MHAPSRPTIGILTASLSGPTELDLWHGVADRARELDVNLLCFSGGIPDWPHNFEAQKNVLFSLAGQQNVDGLLVWSNILSHTLDRQALEAFCQRYAPLPLISMGALLPNIPSIYIDMYDGMCRLLEHLIKIHGCRRIAFIRGLTASQDAEER
jgi:DNA-binding LacI/PurR family transcriptional regulator